MSNATLAMLLVAGMLLNAAPAFAQTVYPLQPDSSKVWIDGTSNKTPEWTVEATELSGYIAVNPSETDPGVTEAELKVPSQKLKGGKSSIMDRLMYKSLKTSEHPEIVYALTRVASVTATGANTFTLQTLGTLTLAGETREIEMTVEAALLADGQIRFTGSHTMLMSDYGIEPPTAMFGALRTGDEVTVRARLFAAPAAAGSQ